MNFHRTLAFLIGVTALGCLPCPAQTTPAKAPRVAFVNIEDAIIGTTDGQNANRALEAEFGPRKTKLDENQQALADLTNRLQQEDLTDEARRKLSKEVDDKTILVNLETEQDDADLDQAQKKMLAGLGKKMMAVIIEYAAAQGYVMVFDISSSQAPLLYADNATDITSAVIAAYQAKHTSAAAK